MTPEKKLKMTELANRLFGEAKAVRDDCRDDDHETAAARLDLLKRAVANFETAVRA